MRKGPKREIEKPRTLANNFRLDSLWSQDESMLPILDIIGEKDKNKKPLFSNHQMLEREIVHLPPRNKKQIDTQLKDEIFDNLSQMKINLLKCDLGEFQEDLKYNQNLKDQIWSQSKKLGNFNLQEDFEEVKNKNRAQQHKSTFNLQKYADNLKVKYSQLQQILKKKNFTNLTLQGKQAKRQSLHLKIQKVKLRKSELHYRFQLLQSQYQQKLEQFNEKYVKRLEHIESEELKAQSEIQEHHNKFLETGDKINNFFERRNNLIRLQNKVRDLGINNAELHAENTATKHQLFQNIHKNYDLVQSYLQKNCPIECQQINTLAGQLEKQDEIVSKMYVIINQCNEIIAAVENFKKNNFLTRAQDSFLDSLYRQIEDIEEDIRQRQQTKFILTQRHQTIQYKYDREGNQMRKQLAKITYQTNRITSEVLQKQKMVERLERELNALENNQQFGEDGNYLQNFEFSQVSSVQQSKPKFYIQTSKQKLENRKTSRAYSMLVEYCSHCEVILDKERDCCKKCNQLVHAGCMQQCSSNRNQKHKR